MKPADGFLLRLIIFQMIRTEGGRETTRARIPIRASVDTSISVLSDGTRTAESATVLEKNAVLGL
jgi:hypothetical protein